MIGMDRARRELVEQNNLITGIGRVKVPDDSA